MLHRSETNPAWFRLSNHCPYSNMPISHPEVLVCSQPGSNYVVEVAKLGERIILIKASGYVRLEDEVEGLSYVHNYVLSHFNSSRGVIYIEDYAQVQGASSEARKKYIDYLRTSDLVAEVILYNLPALFKFSFKLAKKLYSQSERAHATDTYEEAVDLAIRLLNQGKPQWVLKDAADNNTSGGAGGIRPPELRRFFKQLAKPFAPVLRRIDTGLRPHATRDYAEAILTYIASIDWQKEGLKAPPAHLYDDASLRKVFDAIGFVKSEIDGLMREREHNERILTESEQRHRQIVEHARAGIMEYDLENDTILSVNDSLLQILGYTREELLSMNPINVLTETSRAEFTRRQAKLLAGESINQGNEYQLIAKNGETRWVLINSSIAFPERKTRKISVVVTDITRLKQTENKLLEYQQKLKQLSVQLSMTEEAQRRKLAHRLQESINQELFVVQLRLDTLGTALGESSHIREIDQLKNQITKILNLTSTLTSDLSPPVLYDFGLKEAVEFLSDSAFTKYNLPVKTNFTGDMDRIPEQVKFIIYRSIQELIRNTYKHAAGSNAQVSLYNDKRSLQVDYSDDGIGFDAKGLDADQYASDGFGLFDIREKLQHLEGHLHIDSSPGTGTTIHMSVPLNAN